MPAHGSHGTLHSTENHQQASLASDALSLGQLQCGLRSARSGLDSVPVEQDRRLQGGQVSARRHADPVRAKVCQAEIRPTRARAPRVDHGCWRLRPGRAVFSSTRLQ